MLKDSFGDAYSPSLKFDLAVPLPPGFGTPMLSKPSVLMTDGADNPWREVSDAIRPEDAPAPSFDHAQPISPIRDRDFKELADWFDREDMAEIEEDINHQLLMLFPEPCWEDNHFEFLREHL